MDAWFETIRGVVFPWNCDQFGHMNTRWYGHFFDDADYHLWTMSGLAQSIPRVVAQTRIDFAHELKAGELLVVRSAWTRVGTKSLTHLGRMYDAETGTLCATQQTVLVTFDEQKRVSAPMPDLVRETLTPLVIEPGAIEPGVVIEPGAIEPGEA